MTVSALRRDLLDIYHAALRAVEGRQCVAAYLREHPLNSPCYLVALGKAAASMAEGAIESLGDQVRAGLVITKHGYGDPALSVDARLVCLEAGHPFPDQSSLVAGEQLLQFLSTIPADGHCLFLLSGGASALVEVLPPGMTLDDLQQVNQWLLASGLPIGQVNRVRKALSLIKGGRLASRLAGRSSQCLVISDVPGNDLGVIGSGPLWPGVADALADLALPPWLRALLSAVPDYPAVTPTIPHVILADNDVAWQAAVQRAEQLGYRVVRHPALLEGDAALVGQQLEGVMHSTPSFLHVFGGETTVVLPSHPGRGGRCQQLALAAAVAMQGREGMVVLAAGTDGSDGPTDDAGALVDAETVARGRDEGLDAGTALAQCDAGRFLAASGDLISTGPTGSNVMDVVLAIWAEENEVDNAAEL